MPILLLGDSSDRTTQVALDVHRQTGAQVCVIRAPEDFPKLTNLFEGKLVLEKIVVLGFEQPTVEMWEAFLHKHHLYEIGAAITWFTPHH